MESKAWGGRFNQPTHDLVEHFTASILFDRRLYAYDILGSIAHCQMLAKCGIIAEEEASTIIHGLQAIESEIERGSMYLGSPDVVARKIAETIKAVGLSMLIELFFALSVAAVWVLGLVII